MVMIAVLYSRGNDFRARHSMIRAMLLEYQLNVMSDIRYFLVAELVKGILV